MDVFCRRCGEPWEAAYLRHEVAWYTCHHGQTVERSASGWRHRRRNYWDAASQCDDRSPRLEIDPADNRQVPPKVAEVGEQGWYRFVASGLGCPSCYGQPDRQRDVELTVAQLDGSDAATEGEFGHLLA